MRVLAMSGMVALAMAALLMRSPGAAVADTVIPPESAGAGSTIESVLLHGSGVRLHALKSGTTGPVVLLLHGFPLFSYMWEPQLRALGSRARLYAPDGRGFNRSDKPGDSGSYALPELVADVHALGQQLSSDRPFVLVGHDWGGAVAWAFARAYPQRVAHLLVVNAPPLELLRYLLKTDEEQQRSAAYITALLGPGAEQALARDDYAVLRGTLGEITAASPTYGANVDTYIEAWSQPGALVSMLNWYRANLSATDIATASLASAVEAVQVNVPVTVVWGDRDPVFTDRVPRFISQHAPHARLVHMPDAEHTPSLEHSAVFTACLSQVLDESALTTQRIASSAEVATHGAPGCSVWSHGRRNNVN